MSPNDLKVKLRIVLAVSTIALSSADFGTLPKPKLFINRILSPQIYFFQLMGKWRAIDLFRPRFSLTKFLRRPAMSVAHYSRFRLL
jgi:hypothetical protein